MHCIKINPHRTKLLYYLLEPPKAFDSFYKIYELTHLIQIQAYFGLRRFPQFTNSWLQNWYFSDDLSIKWILLKDWSNSLKGNMNKTKQKGHVVKPTQFWESKRHKNLSLVECSFHFRVGTPSSGKEEKKEIMFW